MSRANALGLRRMAQWYRDGRTFTPEFGERDACGCFLHAAFKNNCTIYSTALVGLLPRLLDPYDLIAAGWTGPECTDDAIAVLEMAADLEDCEELTHQQGA